MKKVITYTLAILLSASVAFGQTEALNDGSFEGGTPNSAWAESSTNFTTPLCDVNCGNCGGPCAPNTGSWYAWFGGIGSLELGTLDQNFTVPAGATNVSFSMWIFMPAADPSGTDTFKVKVDGNEEFMIANGDSTTYGTGYSEEIIDFSAYADGGNHALSLWGRTTGPNVTNVLVDDVSLTYNTGGTIVRDLLSEGIRIQPNPASDDLQVVFTAARANDVLVELYTVSGQVVSMNTVTQGQTGTLHIPVSSIASGNYILKINDGANVLAETVLIQH
jgi:hypothetical protein